MICHTRSKEGKRCCSFEKSSEIISQGEEKISGIGKRTFGSHVLLVDSLVTVCKVCRF